VAKRIKQDTSQEIQILEIQQQHVQVAIVGTTPLILNRKSEKARRELLFPKGRKTAAEKAQSLKHEPLVEYRASPYTLPDGPTLLGALATWFKGAMLTAALDLPGVKKAQIGRLVRVEGERLPLYGTPQLHMSSVNTAGFPPTPDIRTRAILPQWATFLTITYPSPQLRQESILHLLGAAGVFAGVGDYRAEKAKGNYGSFRLASANDPELRAILKQGRDAQVEALNTPACYDDESESLFKWFGTEFVLRGYEGARRVAEGAGSLIVTGVDDEDDEPTQAA
jgi:hypothetical protein